MRQVVDINGKVRSIRSIKKIMHSEHDTNGKEVLTPFVEVIIIGKHAEWREWWHFTEFQKYNPEVRL